MNLKNKNKGFSKKFRIKKKLDFERLYNKGKKLFSYFYVIVYDKNNYQYPRLGISVSKKVGKAYKRNYEKRLIRNFFKEQKYLLGYYDIIVIKNKRDGAFLDKKNDFNKILKKLYKNN